MGKRQRRKSKKKPVLKHGPLFIFQLVFLSLGGIGVLILLWCAYKMSDPFPYASYIGAGLVAFATIGGVVTDKSKWSKNRNDYPDNLGGPTDGQ